MVEAVEGHASPRLRDIYQVVPVTFSYIQPIQPSFCFPMPPSGSASQP